MQGPLTPQEIAAIEILDNYHYVYLILVCIVNAFGMVLVIKRPVLKVPIKATLIICQVLMATANVWQAMFCRTIATDGDTPLFVGPIQLPIVKVVYHFLYNAMCTSMVVQWISRLQMLVNECQNVDDVGYFTITSGSQWCLYSINYLFLCVIPSLFTLESELRPLRTLTTTEWSTYDLLQFANTYNGLAVFAGLVQAIIVLVGFEYLIRKSKKIGTSYYTVKVHHISQYIVLTQTLILAISLLVPAFEFHLFQKSWRQRVQSDVVYVLRMMIECPSVFLTISMVLMTGKLRDFAFWKTCRKPVYNHCNRYPIPSARSSTTF